MRRINHNLTYRDQAINLKKRFSPDLSLQKAVRIDERTVIFINQDANADEAKAKFLETLEFNRVQFIKGKPQKRIKDDTN